MAEANTSEVNLQKVDPNQIKEIMEKRKKELVREKEIFDEVIPGDQRGGKPKEYTDIVSQVDRDSYAFNMDSVNELLGTKGEFGRDEFKFVRAGNQIFITKYGGNLHIDVALAKGIIPEDGGIIKRNPETGEIEVYSGSSSLGIKEDNENRDATVKVFQNVDPSVKFNKAKEAIVVPFNLHIQR